MLRLAALALLAVSALADGPLCPNESCSNPDLQNNHCTYNDSNGIERKGVLITYSSNAICDGDEDIDCYAPHCSPKVVAEEAIENGDADCVLGCPLEDE